jgi:hypothetical protein
MPKWSKDAKVFEVAINYSDSRGYQTIIPKPVMEKLGESKRVRFIIKDSKVEVESADS